MVDLIDKHQLQPGERVKFRQYGYKQDYATGRIQKVDAKGVVVVVENAMRKARVEFDDIKAVL